MDRMDDMDATEAGARQGGKFFEQRTHLRYASQNVSRASPRL